MIASHRNRRELKPGHDLALALARDAGARVGSGELAGSATILAVRFQGTRDGKPIDEVRYYLTSWRIGAKALLQQVSDR